MPAREGRRGRALLDVRPVDLLAQGARDLEHGPDVAPAGKPDSMNVGYALSSQEHHPLDLVRHARLAEEAGFRYALISDEFHPLDRPAGPEPVRVRRARRDRVGDRVQVGRDGVTCPLVRMHPAIVAHAAATAAALLPGRFFLGVGTGENLREHVLGDRWPSASERREMLEEAVELIRLQDRVSEAAGDPPCGSAPQTGRGPRPAGEPPCGSEPQGAVPGTGGLRAGTGRLRAGTRAAPVSNARGYGQRGRTSTDGTRVGTAHRRTSTDPHSKEET